MKIEISREAYVPVYEIMKMKLFELNIEIANYLLLVRQSQI